MPLANAPISPADRTGRACAPGADLIAAGLQVEALREVYLGRLERLVHLRQRHYYDLNEQGLRLLDHSIFAAYCDCRDLGAEEHARGTLREADVSVEGPARSPSAAVGGPGPAPEAWPGA